MIFIITAPMFTHALKLELPQTEAAAAPQEGETVTIGIDAAGKLFWNKDAVDAAGLDLRLAAAAKLAVQPELLLRADKNTRYEVLAQVMAAAQAQGLSKLGFVTEPKKEIANGQR